MNKSEGSRPTPEHSEAPKCCYGWAMKPSCVETCPHATEEAKKLLMHRLSYPASVAVSESKRTFVAPRTHDEASERIKACVWEIQVISDAFGYDPFQWLADEEETVAPSAVVRTFAVDDADRVRVADANLQALLAYTGGFYSVAMEHGMKRGETAHAIAHVESAARALHKLAISTPSSATERRDEDRMEWLSVPGRWITPHEGDLAQSFHVARKQAHFYIEGKYTVTEGATARAAIDSAMRATKNPEDREGVQK